MRCVSGVGRAGDGLHQGHIGLGGQSATHSAPSPSNRKRRVQHSAQWARVRKRIDTRPPPHRTEQTLGLPHRHQKLPSKEKKATIRLNLPHRPTRPRRGRGQRRVSATHPSTKLADARKSLSLATPEGVSRSVKEGMLVTGGEGEKKTSSHDRSCRWGGGRGERGQRGDGARDGQRDDGGSTWISPTRRRGVGPLQCGRSGAAAAQIAMTLKARL